MTATAQEAASATGTRRLLAGWHATGRPATLTEHLARYGRMPLRGRGRLAEAVAAAGLTGRGGASFPTGVKMRAVAQRRGPAVVVANGMESEPASRKDRTLLTFAAHLVLDGVSLAADAVGADQAHVCLSRDAPDLIGLVAQAVSERRRAGLDPVPITVHGLPPYYTASEETSLIGWLNGGEAKPSHTPPRPFERGVGKRPTLVDNVETLAHVALIARYGPDWFRRAGTPGAPGTMLVTVSGAAAWPAVYEVAMGTRIGAVLAAAGAQWPAAGVLVGGYFGAWLDPGAAADLPLTPSALGGAGAGLGAGVLAVLPPDACGVAETARVLAYLAAHSAGQCGPCAFGLPAIAGDFARLAAGRRGEAAVERLRRRLPVVTGRGACRHPDGAVRLAASALSVFAADVHRHARRGACAAAAPSDRPPAVLRVPRLSPEGRWR